MMKRTIEAVLVTALIVGAAVFAPITKANDKVTLCHAAGREGTTQYVTLSVGYAAAYGPAGHFEENGTPRAGHEQDYLGECVTTEPTPTPTPTPSPSPSATPSPTPSPSPSPTPTPSDVPTASPDPSASAPAVLPTLPPTDTACYEHAGCDVQVVDEEPESPIELKLLVSIVTFFGTLWLLMSIFGKRR